MTALQRFTLLLLAAIPLAANAAPAAPALLTDMHHTSWTLKDGAPAYIMGLAQTPDGWLWVASSGGLFRFDGVSFERYQPREGQFASSNLWALRVTSDGAVWVGYRIGGASVLHKGRVRNYGVEDGLPASSVADLEEDAAGNIWAATAKGLYRRSGERWQLPPQDMGAPRSYCTLLRDTRRTLWAQCADGAYRLDAGSTRFTRLPVPEGVGRLAQAPDGTVWSTGPDGAATALAGPGLAAPPFWPRARSGGGTLLFERGGEHVWIVGADGLQRASRAGELVQFGQRQGLSGSVVVPLLQDREGNIWSATENGLDRFRTQRLQGVALPQVWGDSAPIAAASDGGLWVGKTLIRHPGRAAFGQLGRHHADRDTVAALWREGPGSVWIAARDGLWHEREGKREHIALPADLPPNPHVYAVVRDRAGDLWIAVRSRGVYRRHDGRWERDPRLAAVSRVAALFVDRDGQLWFGSQDNRLARLRDGQLAQFGTADGLNVGTVLQIAEQDGTLWVGGENGLFHFDGSRFHKLTGVGGDGLDGISGMFFARGKLWLNGIAGISAIAEADLARARREPGFHVPFDRLDHKDGLQGVATQTDPLPSAIEGSDGTLWFATTAGLYWLPPGTGTLAAPVPPVLIRSVTAAGRTQLAHDGARIAIPPRPGRVQFDFTALGLTMAERMQFLYQLEGIDDGWQAAGARRTASYTDLPPGMHRFKVRASNHEGVWNTAEASVDIAIAPTLLQARWFRVLCGAALLAGLLMLYRLRLAQVRDRVRRSIEERMDERQRIARALHDNFLQSVQALVLIFHSTAARLPAGSAERGKIDATLALAERVITEGRDQVHGLRTHDADAADLHGELACVGKTLELGHAAQFRLEVAGSVRPLCASAASELCIIGREALSNAFKHAGATHVTLRLHYAQRSLRLQVVDDGRGIPSDILNQGGKPGHWGLSNMAERVQRLGGALALGPAPGGGTEVTLTIPGSAAYAQRAGWRHRLARLLSNT